MSHSRLSFALETPDALPETGRIAVFAPGGMQDLTVLPQERVVVIQPNKPDHDALAARGFTVTLAPEGSFAAALVFATRAKAQARALIAQAAACVEPGGAIYVDGAKSEGIDSLLKELRGLVPLGQPVAKAHGKIARFAADPVPLADWAARDAEPVAGFVTRPGVFSADGVDEGSALLAASLPETLPARIADLGAGWGWLAAQALAHPGVEQIALYEADATALDCARRNIGDPRALFHWADVTRLTPETRVDAVIMNPPFHKSRDAEPGLGEAFIAAAARLLKPTGTLWMVANRHLPYADALAASFREIEEITPPAGRSTRFRITRAQGVITAREPARAAPAKPPARVRR
ncbi:MFS transporter [Thioclava dalianensis]|uniref:MFS transporter n=1 Tax=Thioclava dalianensis TaxID=1185766 RepID=A0A074U6J6_9RHOB|nr:class I SAM-dependent methyltransferase [Thioclava dalianensis]KEP70237.1 MFS transporter [Thioclava dalianensis]SFM82607.1 16S rRNA (guanine1207-N2)-methyltransferase [Thioclava dalianensis]